MAKVTAGWDSWCIRLANRAGSAVDGAAACWSDGVRFEWLAEVERSSVDHDAVHTADQIVGMDLVGTFEYRIGRGKAADEERMLVEVQGAVPEK